MSGGVGCLEVANIISGLTIPSRGVLRYCATLKICLGLEIVASSRGTARAGFRSDMIFRAGAQSRV
jgi:hypothetical protein